MKKVKKIIMFIIAILLVTNYTVSLAAINPNDYSPGSFSPNQLGEGIDIAQKVVTVINVVGTIVLVSVIIILGMKYMLGSIEQRAEYKKNMLPILIGAILLFGTSWILKIIYSLRYIVPVNV